MDSAWPWLAIAGLGALHGLNPASGWPWAAACGWRRGGASAHAARAGAVGHRPPAVAGAGGCRGGLGRGHAARAAAVAGWRVAAGGGDQPGLAANSLSVSDAKIQSSSGIAPSPTGSLLAATDTARVRYDQLAVEVALVQGGRG